MRRTRIKICGLTRQADVVTAINAGADALGFVFYEKSPRYISPQVAASYIEQIPAFVTAVGLFVNAQQHTVIETVKQTAINLLQFHGDESVEMCAQIAQQCRCPFLRVFRIKSDTTVEDLLQYESIYRKASPYFRGLLLDTYSSDYGGTGKAFNWSLVSKEIGHRVVLSGGLSSQNVVGAVSLVRPYAVDVSSGVEASRGIKDPEKIYAFIRAVRQADALAQA